MAKSSQAPASPRLLVLELWGVGDLALAMPFLQTAAARARVTLVAKPHAAPLLARFAPEVELVPLTAPWTAFRHKYRLHCWPWGELFRLRRELRRCRFDFGVSARPDPRDHTMLALAGARRRVGFPRSGSQFLLTQPLPPPARPHRAEYWSSLAEAMGWPLPETTSAARTGRHLVIHTGAGQPVRQWPRERYEIIADRLRAAGWRVTVLDDSRQDLEALLITLAGADRFIGNDAGPGHLAALLGAPTFTVFGPQLPERFAPRHPQAAWIEGRACPHKPCWDYCRFAEPHCIRDLSAEEVWTRVEAWLGPGP